MRRLLLLLVLAVAAVVLAVRALRGLLARPAAPGSVRTGPSQSLVRDRVCNTYVPLSTALQVRGRDGVRYFCSEACRARHLAGAGRGAAGAA